MPESLGQHGDADGAEEGYPRKEPDVLGADRDPDEGQRQGPDDDACPHQVEHERPYAFTRIDEAGRQHQNGVVNGGRHRMQGDGLERGEARTDNDLTARKGVFAGAGGGRCAGEVRESPCRA